MDKWEAQVRKDYIPPNEAGLTAVRVEFERLQRANLSTMRAIYAVFALVVLATVLFPYNSLSPDLLDSGLPEAILGVVLALFNLVAPRLLAEATRTIDQERIYTLYGRYFSPEAKALLDAEIAVSLDTYRLVIALVSAAGLLALGIRKFIA